MRKILFRFFYAVIVCSTITAIPLHAEEIAARISSRKLHHDLRDLCAIAQAQHAATAATRSAAIATFASSRAMKVNGEKVFVEMTASDTSIFSNATLAQFGIARDAYFGTWKNHAQFLIPIDQLDSLAARSEATWIQPPTAPHALGGSEGVASTGADKYHSNIPPYTGAGIKVAIIDIGFYTYENFLGTALPATVITKSFRSDGDITGGKEPHGAACAEIVHEMAPDAQLYLMNCETAVELGEAETYCEQNGIKVISHSVGWANTSFYDGTGVVNDVVSAAHDAGILWVSAAGNAQQEHWDGTFSDPDANGWENFSAADEDVNLQLYQNYPLQLFLTWDEWPSAVSDYDLFLYSDNAGALTQVASSTNAQGTGQPPTENIYYTPPASGLYHIKIKKKSGADVRLAMFTFDIDFAEHNVPERSVMDPASCAKNFTVGACLYSTGDLENFSSLGPTEDGRQKPDLCGPDATSSLVYNGPFKGTSAATPHVAGAAALLLSFDSNYTNDHLEKILADNAIDLGDPGVDYLYGAGLLQMPDISTLAVHENVSPRSSAIAVFPDPVHSGNALTVLLPASLTGKIQLVDALGRIVKSSATTSVVARFTMNDLPAGLYFCRVAGAILSSRAVVVVR